MVREVPSEEMVVAQDLNDEEEPTRRSHPSLLPRHFQLRLCLWTCGR